MNPKQKKHEVNYVYPNTQSNWLKPVIQRKILKTALEENDICTEGKRYKW